MHSSLSLSAHSRVASSIATLPQRVHASPLLTSRRALNVRSQHAQPVPTSSSQRASQGVVEQQLGCSTSSSLPDTASIWFKSLPSVGDLHNAGTLVPLVLLSLALLAEPAMAQEVQHHAGSLAMPQFDLAEDTSFLQNVARYGKYFVTVMLGTGYVMLKPFAGMFQKPVTAVLAIGGVVGTGFLLKVVLQAMLGVTEPFENLSQGAFLT